MIQEYKDNLLKWIVGEYQTTSQSENEFRTTNQFQNNISNVLNQNGISKVEVSRILSSNDESNYLIYGMYQKNNNTYGYIVVCSYNGEILKVITKYDSGTMLNPIYTLSYDENGNIYGVDATTTDFRVILLNNVAVAGQNGYVCKLRASYYANNRISPQWASIYGSSFIKKVPGEATYFILGTSPGAQQRNVRLIRFKINVGSANEWDIFDGETTESTIRTSDFLISKNGDNITLDISYVITSSGSTVRRINFNGTALTGLTTYDIGIGYPAMDIRMESSNSIYVSSRLNNGNNSFSSILYKVTNMNSKQEIFNYVTENMYIPDHTLTIINGIVFTKFHGTNSTATSVQDFLNVYVNGKVYTQRLVTSADISVFRSTPCQVQQQFNLYKFNIQSNTILYQPTIVFYDDYDGTPYKDYNYFISKAGELYSNNQLVFARSLYDKQTYGNITNSTISVPNNYLNDITIDSSRLLSETMSVLVNDTNQWTKNIYENLFINFSNTIQVIDEDEQILYPSTATFINSNIQTGTKAAYDLSLLNKARINYADGTSRIIKITWIDEQTIPQRIKKTGFGLYVDKDIVSIDYINDNETQVYISKSFNLEVGKYYDIHQKLRID